MKWLDRFHQSKVRPWFVWGLAAIFGLYTFILQGSPSVMIPQLMQTYGIDVVKIAVLTSSFFYTYIFMQIPAGMLVDLWGPRRILKIGFLFCSIAVGWFAFSQAFWEGQMSRMLMGIFTAPAIVSAFCLGSRWFKPAFFTLIVALTEFAALAGGVVGEGGIAYSVVQIGWRETMILVAVIGLALTFLSLFIIHDHPDHDQPLHNGKTFKDTLRETGKNLVAVLSVRQIWMNGIYGGLIFGLFQGFAALWGVPYFAERYDVPVDIAAYVASMFFVGACFGTLVLGWVSVKYPRRKPIMFTGSLVSLAAMLTALYVPGISLKMMFGVIFVLGFFCSSYALCFALAGNYVTKKRKGVAMGFTNMLCILFGAPILQPLIGYLLKIQGDVVANGTRNYTLDDYQYALIPLPICLVLAFLLAFFVREKDPEEED